MGELIDLKNFSSDNMEKRYTTILENFKTHLLENDKAKSASSYVSDVRKFMDWFASKEGYRPDLVTPIDITEFREYLRNNGGRNGFGSKPATINRALASLRVFFQWLEYVGGIKENPARNIKTLTTEKKQTAPKSLKRNEQNRLMREVNSKRDRAILGLMLHAGLRVSEVANLKRENISISPKKGTAEIIGKGNKHRKVPLNKTIRDILTAWLQENTQGPLFPNWHGNPITTRGIFKLVQEYAYAAKIDKTVTPHTLRHTYCKELVDHGVSLDRIAYMAGHSSLDTTNIYTKATEEDLQRDSEKTAWE